MGGRGKREADGKRGMEGRRGVRKNCFSVRKKIEKKVCKFEAVRPRICNVFEILIFLALEQFFPQLVRNIMVTEHFFVYSYFFQCEEKNEKKFWDMEIIGNRRKITFSSIPIFSSVRKKIEKNFWDMEIIGNRRKKLEKRVYFLFCLSPCNKKATLYAY